MTLRPPIPAKNFQRHLAVLSVVTSVISVWLVWQSVKNEPYVEFRTYDALTQLGLASVMMVGWLYLIGAVIYWICTRRINPAWLVILPWALAVLLLLQFCPFKYLDDRARYPTKVRMH